MEKATGPLILPISAPSEEELNSSIETCLHNHQNRHLGILPDEKSQFRAVVVGKGWTEILEKLETGAFLKEKSPERRPKICFLFGGQGNQYPGMGIQIYDTFPIFREEMDKCFSILEEQGIDMKSIMWGNDPGKLFGVLGHIGTFCLQYANAKLWEHWGVKPDVVVGHSLGEIIAAAVAGVLRVEDALKYLTSPAWIRHGPRGKMLALKSDETTVKNLLKEVSETSLEIACFNSPRQTVVAGLSPAIESLVNVCSERNVTTTVINPQMALHTQLAKARLAQSLMELHSEFVFLPAECKFMSSATGKYLESDSINLEYFVNNITVPVKFTSAVNSLLEDDVTMYLEMSPHPVLIKLVQENLQTFTESGDVKLLPTMHKGEDNVKLYAEALTAMYLQGGDIN